MLTTLVTTVLAAEAAAREAANIVMDSTTLLVTVSGVGLTFMSLMTAGIWRIMGLVNNTRVELKEDIQEVHERIDVLTDKYHQVDKEVAVLKEGSGRQQQIAQGG